MKKIYILILVLALIVISGTAIIYFKGLPNTPQENKSYLQAGQKEKVTLTVNYGGENSQTFDISYKEGKSALDLLQDTGLALEVKTYDFGVLIESINGIKNGDSGNYWLYYVNGEAPMVSADKQKVNPGDKIEFKFEKSIF